MWKKDSSINDIMPKKIKKVKFWEKEFDLKKLKIKTIIKISSIIAKYSMSMDSLKELWWNKLSSSLVWLLNIVEEEDIYEIIAEILNTEVKVVEEEFNIADFIKLVSEIIAFEDMKNIFLELGNLTKVVEEVKVNE